MDLVRRMCFWCFAIVVLLVETDADTSGQKMIPMFEPLSDELIWYINNVSNTTWKAKKTSRFHTTSDVRQVLGTVPDPNGFKLQSLCLTSTVRPVDPPKSFDARTAWPHCLSIALINDQSNCGSCWAFGAVEAMSDRICIASKGVHKPILSAEDMVACCRFCGMGCNGGLPAQAWRYWKNHGVVTGGLYNSSDGCKPYSFPPCQHHADGPRPPCDGEARTPACVPSCQDHYKTPYQKDKWYGKSVYQVNSRQEEIMRELMTHGPVEVDFEVYADFPSYSSGVYQHTAGGLLGGHAVRLLGWGEENGVKYWLLANSWNNDWGDQGYFKMLRGHNECGIESHVNAGIPKLSP